MSAWSEAVWLLNQIKNKIDMNTETITNSAAQVYVTEEATPPVGPTVNSIWFVENEESSSQENT